MKVKFFSASAAGPLWRQSDPRRELENEVNRWLSEHPGIQVVSVKQSAAGGSLNASSFLISIWYEDAKTGSEPS